MTPPTAAPTLVAVVHGSPDPRARQSTLALLRRVRNLRPGLRVEAVPLAGGDLPLSHSLRRLSGALVLVPLLFTRGYQVKHGIPEALAAAGLGERAVVAACLGPHPLLVEGLFGRLVEAGHRGPGPVVLAAAGSGDPESAAGTQHTADLFSERLGGAPVVPAYDPASVARPTVGEAVRELRGAGHRQIAVASCFAAPGPSADRCAQAAPGVVARPLGSHASLARLLLHRYDQARGTAPAAPAASRLATVAAAA